MNRPTDWTPLAEADPLPGDPAAIEQEATRLRDFAVEVRDQVTRLRKVASDNETENVGAYSLPLREACSELAGRLEKTIGRYEQVSGHLRGWAPDLRHAQQESLKALTKAKEADPTGATMAGPATPGMPMTEAAYNAQRQPVDPATAEALTAARRQLADAVEHAQTRGRHWAGRIRESIDDEVRDGWWDNAKDFADRNATWIKAVADGLSVVATVAAIAAIVVVAIGVSAIPGLNVLLWSAMVGAAVGHGFLAASGNEKGSWADLGLDVFALATFGTGRLLIGGLKAASGATRLAGAGAASRAARGATLARSQAARRAAAGRLVDARSSAATRRVAREYLQEAQRQASRAGARAARAVHDEPLPALRGLRALRGGDDLAASTHGTDALRLARRFPGDPAVEAAAAGVGWRLNVGAGATATGLTADWADKGATYTDWEAYQDAKGYFRKEVGSTW